MPNFLQRHCGGAILLFCSYHICFRNQNMSMLQIISNLQFFINGYFPPALKGFRDSGTNENAIKILEIGLKIPHPSQQRESCIICKINVVKFCIPACWDARRGHFLGRDLPGGIFPVGLSKVYIHQNILH